MKNSELRRINYLAWQQPSTPKYFWDPPGKKKEFTLKNELKRLIELYRPENKIKYFEDVIELYKLFIKTGWRDLECLDYWEKIQLEKFKKRVYKQKPIPVRKDNFNIYEGQEVPLLCGTRRRPRKCRKTAWKRYYKLFPKENNL
ncbi:MAG: hypothetical protein ABIP51_16890 [Bacteroidia bacterium]